MYNEKTRHFHLLNKITLLAHNPTAPYEVSSRALRDMYDANACYYDIDSLIYTKSSTETTTGDEFFTLTPPTIFSNDTFTKTHIHCVFDILSGNK